MHTRVGVIGAGLMGAEIALVHAISGSDVILVDRDAPILEAATARLRGLLKKASERGIYTSEQAASAMLNLHTTVSLEALSQVEVVTEAVFESLEMKVDVLSKVADVCGSDCLLATNTSTIPISTIAAQLPAQCRPRFIGTHYFSPVSRMKLVEVIPGFETSEATVSRTFDLLQVAGKTPIRVKDVAGFAVNRMLHALLIEAIRLVEEGVASPEDLDRACQLGLGHPIGPFALMDAVTSSLCVQAQEIMQEAYGERFRPPALLKQRVRSGFVGGKGRHGWLT